MARAHIPVFLSQKPSTEQDKSTCRLILSMDSQDVPPMPNSAAATIRHEIGSITVQPTIVMSDTLAYVTYACVTYVPSR